VPGEDAASAAAAVTSGDAFCIRAVSEVFRQTLQPWGGGRSKGTTKGFCARCLYSLSLRTSYELCFVVFLPTASYAVSVAVFSSTGEHQLWSVNEQTQSTGKIVVALSILCVLHV